MTHTYKISGMTCNGCRTSVENKLGAVDGVKKASVNLENEVAVIEMEHHIGTNTLQKALPEKYGISDLPAEKNKTNVFAESSVSSPATEGSKIQQLKPLFLILGYIAVATVLLNFRRANWDGAMLDFMGLFFIVFSFFKILDLAGFTESFSMYDPLAKVLPVYGWIYPFIETALGLMFLMRFQVPVALIATLVVLGITTIGVSRTLLSKKSIQCACLGTALKLPMTEATFIENAIMIVMAAVVLLNLL